MRRNMRAIIVLLSIVASSFTGNWQESGWVELHSEDRSFSVLMPKRTDPYNRVIETPTEPIKVHELLTTSAGVTYIASYATNPIFKIQILSIEEQLDGIRDEAVIKKKSRLIRERDLVVNELHGKELIYEVENGYIFYNRYFIVKGRLYQVLASVKRELADDRARECEMFLNSLRIHKELITD
jgi:hypothetical protein